MTFTDEYHKAELALRDLNAAESKITFQARHRIASKSLKEQLIEHMKSLRQDQSDVDFAFEADRTPPKSKGWE